jgi:hypothetical protein
VSSLDGLLDKGNTGRFAIMHTMNDSIPRPMIEEFLPKWRSLLLRTKRCDWRKEFFQNLIYVEFTFHFLLPHRVQDIVRYYSTWYSCTMF